MRRFAPALHQALRLATIAVGAVALVLTAGPAGAAPSHNAAQTSSGTRAEVVVAASVLAGFEAGRIIDDAVFFASGTMNAAAIQSFLNARVPTCRSGYTCLKDYAQATQSRATDPMCSAYAGKARETAAEIIANVANACGINPQVLLATLQKEQGLVTNTWPSDWRYTIAMGQGCPDTAACDTRYYGFFNQVYGAAWQLKRYANPPGTSKYFTWYAPGSTWSVRYHPDVACGSSPVFIQNQATANLYYYTPYQPNAASLAAVSGEGDGCSSYGNRNFYRYFTEWFGSTRSIGPRAIAAKYAATGGATGPLGAARNSVTCGLADGGCYQVFAAGQIHWSPGYGAFITTGAILSRWAAGGYERGALGYPISDQTCGLAQSGCYQVFQRGQVHWTSSAGAHATSGGIGSAWARNGYERGALGYPVGEEICGLAGGGCYQLFQNGQIHWAPGVGAFATTGGFLSLWASTGYEGGSLGYPRNDRTCGLPADGCYQLFQKGQMHWSEATGVHSTGGGIGGAWARSGYERGPLGYPTTQESCGLASSACAQDFQGGTIAWTPGIGAYAVRSDLKTAWLAAGGGAGAIGYPITEQSCGLSGGGCHQLFQVGEIHWTPTTGAQWTHGAIGAAWARSGWENGPLGYPTSAESCDSTTRCVQTFERGSITWIAGVGTSIARS